MIIQSLTLDREAAYVGVKVPLPRAGIARAPARRAAPHTGCLGVLLPATGAQAQVVQRPISEFVNAQGTYCYPDGQGGCYEWLPPYPNFQLWNTPSTDLQQRCALVDYAGLAARTIYQNSGGTIDARPAFSGTITERPRDGRVEVTVRLDTTGAITYAVNGCALGGTNIAFGYSLNEITAGTPATRGTSHFELQYFTVNLGDPMPDFIQILTQPTPDRFPLTVSFRADADGPLRAAFGVPDGTPGHATITLDHNFDKPDKHRNSIDLRAIGH